jgi:hypothetical protein
MQGIVFESLNSKTITIEGKKRIIRRLTETICCNKLTQELVCLLFVLNFVLFCTIN